MAEEIKKYEFKVLRIEEGKENKYRFVFGCEFGEYPLEEGKDYYNLFKPGNKYIGVVKFSGMPDFIGDEDKMENVCTVSPSLEKILDEEEVVWEKKK